MAGNRACTGCPDKQRRRAMDVAHEIPFDKDSIVVCHVPILRLSIRLSTIKYLTFMLSGIASLWPWNCFLSASDYFQDRFGSHPVLADNYSSTMMTVSTITSTLFNYYLSRSQQGVNYARRLKNGNYLQMLIFLVMTLSILVPERFTVFYFVFVMFNVLLTSIGSCLTQVGMMALVNIQGSFYANATVVGNAIAGVLPSIAMIIAVVSNPMIDLHAKHGVEQSQVSVDRSAEAVKYFLTSVFMALLAQISFWIMEHSEKSVYVPVLNDQARSSESSTFNADEVPDEVLEERIGEISKPDTSFVGFGQLWSKLKYVESTIILTFSLTLVFPVFASSVESETISKKLFIPLAFLVWNIGDLLGRILCATPYFLIKKDKILISYSIARIVFIPLFLMCNIKDRGGRIGDVGYLLIQLLFGLTNGQLFSSSYMCVGGLLDTKDEQRAAAAFTALLINMSLLAGSLASFGIVYLCL